VDLYKTEERQKRTRGQEIWIREATGFAKGPGCGTGIDLVRIGNSQREERHKFIKQSGYTFRLRGYVDASLRGP